MNETEKAPDDIGALIVSPKAYATQKQLMAGFRWLRHNIHANALSCFAIALPAAVAALTTALVNCSDSRAVNRAVGMLMLIAAIARPRRITGAAMHVTPVSF